MPHYKEASDAVILIRDEAHFLMGELFRAEYVLGSTPLVKLLLKSMKLILEQSKIADKAVTQASHAAFDAAINSSVNVFRAALAGSAMHDPKAKQQLLDSGLLGNSD